MNDGPLSLIAFTALVSLAPLLVLSTTAFVKASTVLQILRSAIGVEGVPGSAVVTAFAFALSLLVMTPVLADVAARARPVLDDKTLSSKDAAAGLLDAAMPPLRAFMKANASPKERARYLALARKASRGGAVGEDDLAVLMPAFLTTELGEAFELGFLLLLPFLVVDLVIASVLASIGLTLDARQVALGLKLLLFAAVDGFGLVAQALVASY